MGTRLVLHALLEALGRTGTKRQSKSIWTYTSLACSSDLDAGASPTMTPWRHSPASKHLPSNPWVSDAKDINRTAVEIPIAVEEQDVFCLLLS